MSSSKSFVKISAGYQFQGGLINPSVSTKYKTHKRNCRSSLKIYRAYDKQRLLQQIDNKLQKKERMVLQNKILKAQLAKNQNKNCYKVCDVGQAKMILECLQKQNEGLNRQLSLKTRQLDDLKKTKPYTQFLQEIIELHNNQQELSRLNQWIKEKKSRTLLEKKMRKNLLAQLTNNIERDKRSTIEKKVKNHQLSQIYQNMKQQIILLKDKTNCLERNKKKLQQDIEYIKNQLNEFRSTHTSNTCRAKQEITKIRQHNQNIYNQAIKIKKKKIQQQGSSIKGLHL